VVHSAANRITHIAHGVLHAADKLTLGERLLLLEGGLLEVIERYAPAVGSVETLFFYKDAQAAAKLGHARGMVLLSLQRKNVAIAEYQPARVKSMVTGRGRAEKSQVAQMIRVLLNLNEIPEEDAADALALAVTHIRRGPMDERLAKAASPVSLALARLPSARVQAIRRRKSAV
jgi:crossover junction endodeoxyribonuclease RuvC